MSIFLSRSSMYMHITIFFLVVYASGGLCKSSVEAAYRSICHLLRLVCISGLCQQSHILALSLLLVVAGDVETNPGPLDGRCRLYVYHHLYDEVGSHCMCNILYLSPISQFEFELHPKSKPLLSAI